MIITIDGPAGTGKTTVARGLAEALGFTYFDTGAMYRALTYGILSKAINPDAIELINQFLEAFPITIKSHRGEKRICLGDEDCTDKIRTQEVTTLVSKISAYPSVREKLVATQRELSKGVNAVFEGRDMGSVVFPDADVKIFLTADPRVRAERRYSELVKKDPNYKNLSIDSILEEINQRDKYDASRDISPMKPADDSIIIDTSNITIDEVINRIVNIKETKETRSRT